MSRRQSDGRTQARSPGPAHPGRPVRRMAARPQLRTAVVLLAALGLVAVATAGARAVTVDADGPAARLVLTGLQAVVGPAASDEGPAGEQPQRLPSALTSRVLIENTGTTALEDVRLVVEVYDRATSRSALRAALDGPGPVIVSGPGQLVQDDRLDVVPSGGIAQLDITIDGESAGLVDPDDDVTIRPVVVSLFRGSLQLDQVRTAAIGIARPVVRPLETSVVLPLDGPAPAVEAARAAASGALLPGGRLDRLLRAGEALPPDTLTLAPAAHTAEDLTRLADATVPGASDVLERLRQLLATSPAGVISTPYGLADVPALASGGATNALAIDALAAGRQRLLRLVGQPPGAAHLVVGPQTAASLDLAPVDVLVTRWDSAAGPDLVENPTLDIPPALRSGRAPTGRTLDLLVADPWATTQLAEATGAHGWAVDAHRVVAESAMAFAEQPGVAGRAFAVVPPTGWEAPGRLPDELYARLAAAPWLRLADPATVVARSEVSAPWSPVAVAETRHAAVLQQLSGTRDRLLAMQSAVAALEELPAALDREDDLLRAVTTWPSAVTLDDAARALADVRDGIDATIGEVTVPDASAITLASERGVIPVTVRHPEGVPLDVVVEVATQGRLTFGDGAARAVHLEESGTSTVSFEATALGRGTFPLAVTVRTPSGGVELARALVPVRATAVSRPALLIIGGVVVLLLLVGRLRPRRPSLQVVE